VRIFAYWDKPERIPAYLQLCLATWRIHGGISDVHLVTDRNLHEWLDGDVLDLTALQHYPVAERKDAIEIAILARYGGLFLDVDTICAGPPLAIGQALAGSEIALYGYHVAAVAARPGSTIMQRWLALLQQTLALPREQLVATGGPNYLQLGNYTFELLRTELATGTPAIPGACDTRPARRVKAIRRHWFMQTRGRRFIRRLDPHKTGFIAEQGHRSQDRLDAPQRYLSFWFNRDLPDSVVTGNRGALIGLHHSWTPADYTALSLEELSADRRLLSRYLMYLLRDTDYRASPFATDPSDRRQMPGG
jgi:hypothetical protein